MKQSTNQRTNAPGRADTASATHPWHFNVINLIMKLKLMSRVLAWNSKLSVHVFLRPRTLQPHSGKLSDDASAIRHCSRDVGWSPSGSFLQIPNIESLLSTALLTAPLVTKTCMPRQTSLLGLPAKFQTWALAAWLWPGPDSQLSNLSFRGAPSSTTPCPSPPPDTAGLPG
jgi:hypothetical protein